MITRGEAARLLRLGRSLDAIALGARLTARYLADRLRYRRGTRLVLGNALAARLYRNLLDRDVPVWRDTHTTRLVRDANGIAGVVVQRGDAARAVRARRGVVLAGGGFPANGEWRERHLPAARLRNTPRRSSVARARRCSLRSTSARHSAPTASTTRCGSRARSARAATARRWCTRTSCSTAPSRGSSRSRARASASSTRRCRITSSCAPCTARTLECRRSPHFSCAIAASSGATALAPIRPRTLRLGPYLRSGYVKTAPTLPDLARAIGVDPDGLARHGGAAQRVRAYRRRCRFRQRGQCVRCRQRRSRAPPQSMPRADRRSRRSAPSPCSRRLSEPASDCVRTFRRACAMRAGSRSEGCTRAATTCNRHSEANTRAQARRSAPR